MKFSLIIPYHDNPSMLRAHYAYLMYLRADQAREVELVVCDDASTELMPEPPRDLAVRVTQYRIDPPHIPWSHRCATNIAAHYATGERFIVTDIDHIIQPDAWRALFDMSDKDFPTVGTFKRRNLDKSEYRPHPDSWIMRRTVWDLIGGYDTRLRGHYGQNSAIIERIAHYATAQQIDVTLTRVSRDDVPDASERVLPRKSPEDRMATHRLMSQFRGDGTFYDKQPLVEHRKVWPNADQI